MSQKDIIKELVGLQDVIVNKIEQSCNSKTDKIHDYRITNRMTIWIINQLKLVITAYRNWKDSIIDSCGQTIINNFYRRM